MFVGCIELDKAEIGERFFEGIEDNDSMELVYLNLLMGLEVVSPVSAVENEQNQESMAKDEGNILWIHLCIHKVVVSLLLHFERSTEMQI